MALAITPDRFSRTRSHRGARAFTLVELLVAISVIALLMGALVPALSGGYARAKELGDANGIRQLVMGYHQFSAQRADALLVGYYAQDPGYKLDDTLGGMVVKGLPRQRYPWRLASFLDAGLRGTFLVGQQEDFLDEVPAPGTSDRDWWQYRVSTLPSFGINAHFLGGYKANAPGIEVGSPSYVKPPSYKVVKMMSRVSNPSRFIAFGSARGEDWNPKGGGATIAQGWYLVESPALGDLGPFGGGKLGPWDAAPYTDSAHPERYGNIDPRYRGRMLIGHVDGHVDALTPEDARDMTLWSDDAARSAEREWKPASY